MKDASLLNHVMYMSFNWKSLIKHESTIVQFNKLCYFSRNVIR